MLDNTRMQKYREQIGKRKIYIMVVLHKLTRCKVYFLVTIFLQNIQIPRYQKAWKINMTKDILPYNWYFQNVHTSWVRIVRRIRYCQYQQSFEKTQPQGQIYGALISSTI